VLVYLLHFACFYQSAAYCVLIMHYHVTGDGRIRFQS